jgi:5-methylcytosine-specific restriction endonuclease McrA
MRTFYKEQREEKVKLWKEGILDGRRGNTATAHWLRDYFLEQCDHKCQECGWGETNPYTGLIPLELEHIDGDYTNNKEENLKILCPNCHALTSTYKGDNKKIGRPRSKYYRGT